jgi:hypothetical protein
MNSIKCQFCAGEEEGCVHCGGYGVVARKQRCASCDSAFWVQPARADGRTIYPGLFWRSFDGVLFTAKKTGKNNIKVVCSNCPEPARELKKAGRVER